MTDDKGAPISGAVVKLSGDDRGLREKLTEAEGHFVFADVPVGRYSITSEKHGWVEGAYGRAWPTGQSKVLIVREGERVIDVPIAMWRTAQISGTVRDEQGAPIVWASVRALHRLPGQPLWSYLTQAGTDDRGLFKLTSLPAGEYLVVVPSIQVSGVIPAEPLRTSRPLRLGELAGQFVAATNPMMMAELGSRAPPDRSVAVDGTWLASSIPVASRREDEAPRVYRTTYYPGSSLSGDAMVVAVRAGETRGGIDITMTPGKSYSVSGTVTRNGQPVPEFPRTRLQLVPAASTGSTNGRAGAEFPVALAFTETEGEFRFVGVPPGAFDLIAHFGIPFRDGEMASVRLPLLVPDADVSGVDVRVQDTHTVTGRLEFQGTAPPPIEARLASIEVMLEAVTYSERPTAGGRVSAASRFSLPVLGAATYHVRVNADAILPWRLDAVVVGDRVAVDDTIAVDSDLTDVALRFVDADNEISGRVTTTAGPDPLASVVVFPGDMDLSKALPRRRLATVRVDENGDFVVSGLPNGRYIVAALSDQRVATWDSPALLPTLAARGTRVELSGSKVTVPLTPVPR